MSQEYPVTDRSRVKLFGTRASHAKADIHTAIDACLYGTVAYAIDDQPYATPTMVWRSGDYIYWHGSAGSRMLKTVAAGCNVCVTFVHVDGFVLSRLASAHAMNYRSVMVFGTPEPVEDLAERRAQLEFFLSRLFPGRWQEVKQPSLEELKAIIMVRMRIDEASLKKRAGPPADGRPVFGGEKLYEQACWAGVLPISTSVGRPEDADRLHESVAIPAYLQNFAGRFGMAMRDAPKTRFLAAEVASIRPLTRAVKAFRLTPKAGAFPPAAAGAHLQIGVILPDRTRDWRRYTIVRADREGAWYEIAVLREASGRGGSAHLHDTIRKGDSVQLLPPENDFALAPEGRRSILIAGGIGITPIFAMAEELVAADRPAEIHYSARGVDAAAFLDALGEMKHTAVRFYDTSRGAAHRMNAVEVLAPFEAGTHVYVCGPTRLIADVVAAAEALGYPTESIHREAFGAPAPQASDLPVQVTLVKSQKTVKVLPGQSILDAVTAEGVEVRHSCKRGECGLCATGVVDGTPDHRDHFLTAPQKAEGKMCICVSWANSPSLLLDL